MHFIAIHKQEEFTEVTFELEIFGSIQEVGVFFEKDQYVCSKTVIGFFSFQLSLKAVEKIQLKLRLKLLLNSTIDQIRVFRREYLQIRLLREKVPLHVFKQKSEKHGYLYNVEIPFNIAVTLGIKNPEHKECKCEVDYILLNDPNIFRVFEKFDDLFIALRSKGELDVYLGNLGYNVAKVSTMTT